MEKENTQEKPQDSRNFADKWLNNIFEVLMRIEDYERLAKNGCVTLLDYVQNPQLDLALIQNKNYELFMTEVEVLLNNVKYFVNKKDFLVLLLKFKVIKDIERSVDGFLDLLRDEVAHEEWNVLKPEFVKIHPLMSDLRGMIVKTLFEFINPKFNVKGEEKL